MQSVRHTLGAVEVVHFTDEQTFAIAGADTVIRRPTTAVALACVEHYAECQGDWLFVDTDVLIQRNVSHVFDEPFDIAVATREGTLKDSEVGTKFMDAMPFNKGAVFSRSPQFWRAVVDRCRQFAPKRQQWMGDQRAMCDVIASGVFAVKVLPARFNYPPKSPREDWRQQAIVHLKGPRKQWVLKGCVA